MTLNYLKMTDAEFEAELRATLETIDTAIDEATQLEKIQGLLIEVDNR